MLMLEKHSKLSSINDPRNRFKQTVSMVEQVSSNYNSNPSVCTLDIKGLSVLNPQKQASEVLYEQNQVFQKLQQENSIEGYDSVGSSVYAAKDLNEVYNFHPYQNIDASMQNNNTFNKCSEDIQDQEEWYAEGHQNSRQEEDREFAYLGEVDLESMGANEQNLSTFRKLGTIEEVTGRMEATMDNLVSARYMQGSQNIPFESDVKEGFPQDNIQLRHCQQFMGPKIDFDHMVKAVE